jgi:hypothetical protein
MESSKSMSDVAVGTVGTVGLLSDCRTVGLSDLSDCRTLSDFTVGLSDQGSTRGTQRRH